MQSRESTPAAGAERAASDGSLLRQYRAGNEDAATELYNRYAQRLRALAMAQCSDELARCLEVEDIVQSVFGSFFRGVARGQYDVPAGEELWKLFLVIGLNKIRAKANYHRAAKRDIRQTVGDTGAEVLAQMKDPSSAASLTFLKLVITETLDSLPETQRQIILARLEGYEVAEIARMTERSQRTVERVLQGFRNLLAEQLSAEERDEGRQ